MRIFNYATSILSLLLLSSCAAFSGIKLNINRNLFSNKGSKLFQIGSGEQYGDSSYIVKEFTMYEDLEEIVQLASQPIPERKTFASND